MAYLSQTNDRKSESIKEITYKSHLAVSELRRVKTEGLNENHSNHSQNESESERTGKEQALKDEIYSKSIHIDELLCQVGNLHQRLNFYQEEVNPTGRENAN